MALKIAVLADDLTGALDSAAPFATHGLRVTVAAFVSACDATAMDDCDVFAVNTETRALAPEAAAGEVARAWERLASFAPDIVFKKIDSRLKGNVETEVAALMTASGRTHAIVAPAIPEMGRFVISGAVVGFGVDGPLPISERIDLSNVSAPDCADHEALRKIAATLIENRATHLAIGAAGLAEAMAERLGRRPPDSNARRERRGPVLVIAGSRDPITLEQLARLERSDLPVVAFSPRLLELPETPADAEVIVLRAAQDESASSPRIARMLARLGRTLIDRAAIETVVVTGGETGEAFVREAGMRILKPDGVVMLGVATARVTIQSRALTLITKSGGLGSPDTLVDIARRHAGPKRGLTK